MKRRLRFAMLLAAAAILILSIGIIAYAEDGTEITCWDDLEMLLMEGGRGYLTANIDNEGYEQFDMYGGDVILDMNGYYLSYWGPICNISENLILINSSDERSEIDLVCDRAEHGVYTRVFGTLAAKNVDIYISDLENNGKIITLGGGYRYGYHEINSGLIANLDNEYGTMTDDQFIDMVQTGTLPQLTRQSYDFVSWTCGKNEVTSFDNMGGKKTVSANWQTNVLVTFDPDGGTCDVTAAKPDNDSRFSAFPGAEKEGFCFDGWFNGDGTQVTTDTEFNADTTVTAGWSLESTRAEALADYMKAQGFCQTRIDRVTGSLNGENLSGSFFSFGNIWMILCCVLTVILVVMIAVIRVKRKSGRKESSSDSASEGQA